MAFLRQLKRIGVAARFLAIARLAGVPATFALFAMPAHAEPHRCTATDGSVSFQEGRCAPGAGHDAPLVTELLRAKPEDGAASARPASFHKLQRLMIYSVKCPLPRLAGEEIELVRQHEALTWPAKKIDEQTAHDVLVASIGQVDKEMAANPAVACANAQRDLDDWVRRTPGAQKRLDDVAPLIRP